MRRPRRDYSVATGYAACIASQRLFLFALVLFLAVLTTAPAAVAKTSSTCAAAEDSLEDAVGDTPATISEALNPAVVARYAIFRRPAAPADLPPPINALADQVTVALGRYNPAYVRQLTERIGGRRLFVVPGLPPHIEVPPARCLPRRLRPQRPQLVAQQLRRERQPLACIVTVLPSGAPNERSGQNCSRFRDVTKYENLSSGAFGGFDHAGILPDGIATVRVHFSRTPMVQVPVVENFYLYKVDSSLRRKLRRQLGNIFRQLEDPPSRGTRAQRRKLQRELFARLQRTIRELTPTNIELLAADGRVVKDVKRPRDAGLGSIFDSGV